MPYNFKNNKVSAFSGLRSLRKNIICDFYLKASWIMVVLKKDLKSGKKKLNKKFSVLSRLILKNKWNPSLPSPCAHSTQLDLTWTRKKLKEKRQNKLNSWELWISFVFLSLIHRIPSTASRHLLLLHPLLGLSYVFL